LCPSAQCFSPGSPPPAPQVAARAAAREAATLAAAKAADSGPADRARAAAQRAAVAATAAQNRARAARKPVQRPRPAAPELPPGLLSDSSEEEGEGEAKAARGGKRAKRQKSWQYKKRKVGRGLEGWVARCVRVCDLAALAAGGASGAGC
jgi:hypothetical protein